MFLPVLDLHLSAVWTIADNVRISDSSWCWGLVMCVFSHIKYRTLINENFKIALKKNPIIAPQQPILSNVEAVVSGFWENWTPNTWWTYFRSWLEASQVTFRAWRSCFERICNSNSEARVIFTTRGTQNRCTTDNGELAMLLTRIEDPCQHTVWRSLRCGACMCRRVRHRWHNNNCTTCSLCWKM